MSLQRRSDRKSQVETSPCIKLFTLREEFDALGLAPTLARIVLAFRHVCFLGSIQSAEIVVLRFAVMQLGFAGGSVCQNPSQLKVKGLVDQAISQWPNRSGEIAAAIGNQASDGESIMLHAA